MVRSRSYTRRPRTGTRDLAVQKCQDQTGPWPLAVMTAGDRNSIKLLRLSFFTSQVIQPPSERALGNRRAEAISDKPGPLIGLDEADEIPLPGNSYMQGDSEP